MSTFRGIVENITYRNDSNGWTVAAVKLDDLGRMSAVGIFPFLEAGERVELEGELVEHKDYGRQVKASGYRVLEPEGLPAIEQYLGSGLIKGVREATARKIVKHFGAETLSILDADPTRVEEVRGIGHKQAMTIAASYAEQRHARTALMMLQSWGLSPNMAQRVLKTYGDMTETVLRANPYRMVSDVQGVGFRTADAIALGMGFSPESEFRLQSGVIYALSEAVNQAGHTYLPLSELVEGASRLLNAPVETIDRVARELTMKRALVLDASGEEERAYLPHLYEAERNVALLLLALKRAPREGGPSRASLQRELDRYQKEQGLELNGQQENAVITAVTEGVAVITGGPGTGKTTSIRCILRLADRLGEVQLCAPTGRAAKRMSEATHRPAQTIHRLLEYGGEGLSFGRGPDNPLDCDVLIVDETSMVDLFIMQALLKALRPSARLILVGDADQLPSVGAGNVLRDMIASGALPVARLTEIYRQAQQSMIVVNAHRINRGEMPLLRNRDTDFFIERHAALADARRATLELVTSRLPGYLGVDPREIQVMAPMKKGDLGVLALNQALQQALNPGGPRTPQLLRGETAFRLGDKVMQIRNDYDLAWVSGRREGRGVFNGDMGIIEDVDREGGTLSVLFDDGRRAEYEGDALEELELAYCISVHKSQGSEFEAVVLPLMGGPDMLLNRSLLYTAVTRAKRLVMVVGREETLKRMVLNNQVRRRYSALAERLSAGEGPGT